MPPATVIPADNLDFAWDRPESAESLRLKLAAPISSEWLRTAAWLIQALWDYVLRSAHELGRL